MPANNALFSFQIQTSAPANQVYRCFTTDLGFQEWLSNGARTISKPGGMFVVWWNTGYYASGEFIKLEQDREVLVSWRGHSDPQRTQIHIQISENQGLTTVDLYHSGIGSEEIWAETRKEIQKGWEVSLKNLVSVLETGVDLRIKNRPTIGVYPVELTPENSSKYSTQQTSGVYLQDVIEGRSAHLAGLRAGDILVQLGNESLTGINGLLKILQENAVGDTIEVKYFRNEVENSTQMELRGLPMPEIPNNAVDLAHKVEEIYRGGFNELQKCFSDVDEETASKHPAPEEWSAKEILVHLIQTERDVQYWIQSSLVDQDFEWTENTQARIKSTLEAYPSISDLLGNFRCSQTETTAFLARLPQSFVSRRSSFWRLSYGILTLSYHTQEHITQIRRAISGAG